MTDEQKLAATSANALAVVDFGDDAGKGMENFTQEHFKLPFMRVLHYDCPQVNKNEDGIPDDPAKFIHGAKPGMLFNTATGEVYDGTGAGIGFIPVSVDHSFVEQKPFDGGGGFVGVRKPKDDLVLKLQAQQGRYGRLKTDEGTELAETFTLYGLYVAAGFRPFRGATTFSSTRIPVYQAWASRANNIIYQDPKGNEIRPPLWAHKMILRTVPDKAKKNGKKFFNYNLTYDGKDNLPVNALMRKTDPLYVACQDFNKLIEEGRITVDRTEQTTETAQPGRDDDIPF